MKRFFLLTFTILAIFFITSCGEVKSTSLFSVIVTSEGLEFTINPEENHENILFYVIDSATGKENARITGNRNTTEYKYPFVQKDKEYKVYAIFYDRDWNWYERKETEKITVKATGGLGDYNISATGFVYNGDREVSITGYTINSPVASYDWQYAQTVFCYNSDKSQNPSSFIESWNLIKETDWQKGTFKISDECAEILASNKYFWFKFRYSFSYNNISYEYYVESQPVIFEYQKSSSFISTGKGDLTISKEYNGINVYTNLDSFYKNIRIRVWDETNNRNCPSLSSTNPVSSYYYPFLQVDCNYKINIDAWDENWSNYYRSEELRFTPEGGKGNFIFTYSDAIYNDTDTAEASVSQLILENFSLNNPLSDECSNITCTGTLYYSDDSVSSWNFYAFNNGIIDLSKKLSFLRSKEFQATLEYNFSYANQNFEYGFINKSDKTFKDHHIAPKLILNKNYHEIYDFGTYTVENSNTEKKAYLITYNKSYDKKGDSKTATSRNAVTARKNDSDCFIADLPKGEIVSSAARAAVSGPDYSSYKVGSTKKYFDGHESTLVATGNHCNIWFYNSNNSSTKQIQAAITSGDFSYSRLASYFDSLFEVTTYVFGSHVPKLQFSNVISVTEDTKIDLFVTDLRAAGYQSSMGFYHSKNMYKGSGNECEMVYIDVQGYLTYKWGILNIVMHEFQHLLTDVNKTFSYSGGYYDHDYTELMSTTCENVLQTLYPEDSGIRTTTNGMVGGRMSGFTGGYMVGISNWQQLDGNSSYSYGTNCAFGDFIMRNFGGVEVLRRITHNSYFNRDAIVQGVNSMGYNETLDSLMMKFALSIINTGLEESKAAGGITAVKYVSTDATVYGKNIKFELMPLYYNWYYASNPSIYDANKRYEKMWDGNYENKGPAIIDNNYTYSTMYPKSFNIKYLGKNLSSITIDNPGEDFIIGVAFN